MTRADWLRWRQGGLGGSDLGQIPSIVAAVGGDPEKDCAPWEGAGEWHVWASKLDEPRERADREDLETGQLLERTLLDWAATQIVPARHSHELMIGWHGRALERGALRGSPDGAVRFWPYEDHFDEVATRIEGIECKVTDAWKPWEVPPVYYQLQCRAYMALTGWPRWSLAAFFRHLPAWRLYTLERDLDIEARMLAAVEDWWERRIIRGEHPEIDASAACSQGLARLHPRTAGTSFADFRVATPDEVRLVTEASRLRALARDVDQDARRLENDIRRRIGDSAGLRWTGGKARWAANNHLKITIQEG